MGSIDPGPAYLGSGAMATSPAITDCEGAESVDVESAGRPFPASRAVSDGCFGEDFSRGHHALTADADDENVAGRSHASTSPDFTSLIGDTGA